MTIDLNHFEAASNALYLALPGPVADDYVPMAKSVVEELRQARAVIAAAALTGIPLDEIATAPARRTDPGTSKTAAMILNGKNARGKAALAYYRHRFLSMTSEEAALAAGIAHMACPWKRISELKEAGIIAVHFEVPSSRGVMVESYKITQFGLDEVERTMPNEAAQVRREGDPT